MNKKIAAIVSVWLIVVVIASLGCLDDSDSAKIMEKITPEGTKYLGHFDFQT